MGKEKKSVFNDQTSNQTCDMVKLKRDFVSTERASNKQYSGSSKHTCYPDLDFQYYFPIKGTRALGEMPDSRTGAEHMK